MLTYPETYNRMIIPHINEISLMTWCGHAQLLTLSGSLSAGLGGGALELTTTGGGGGGLLGILEELTASDSTGRFDRITG